MSSNKKANPTKNRPKKVNNLKSKAINFIAKSTIKINIVSRKTESRYAKATSNNGIFFDHAGRQQIYAKMCWLSKCEIFLWICLCTLMMQCRCCCCCCCHWQQTNKVKQSQNKTEPIHTKQFRRSASCALLKFKLALMFCQGVFFHLKTLSYNFLRTCKFLFTFSIVVAIHFFVVLVYNQIESIDSNISKS